MIDALNNKEVYRTDDNLEDWQDKFGAQIDAKCVYNVLQKYFCDLGIKNFPAQIDLEIRCTVQKEMKKLFESKKKVNRTGASDAPTCIC